MRTYHVSMRTCHDSMRTRHASIMTCHVNIHTCHVSMPRIIPCQHTTSACHVITREVPCGLSRGPTRGVDSATWHATWRHVSLWKSSRRAIDQLDNATWQLYISTIIPKRFRYSLVANSRQPINRSTTWQPRVMLEVL